MFRVLVEQTSVICISLLDSSVESFALANVLRLSFIICHGRFCSFFFVLRCPKNAESLLSFDMTLHLCTSSEGLSIKHVDLYNLHPYSVYSN